MKDKLNVSAYKAKLLEEKVRLEKNLSDVGRKNPDTPGDWEATGDEAETEPISDPNDIADSMEEFESRSATLAELEIGLKDVNDALAKIEKGTYGICEISGEQIETDRLDANPAARTCKTHINEQAA